MRKKCELRFVDFAARAKKDKDFANSVGLYCPDENIAYIDKYLPKVNKGSRDLCRLHEEVHSRTWSLDLNLLYSKQVEESLVELEAVTRTKNSALSSAELMLKYFLTEQHKLDPRNTEDLKKILCNIFRFMGIRHNRKIISMIATGKDPRKPPKTGAPK